MNAAARDLKIHKDDLVIDHVTMLSKHETEITALKLSDIDKTTKISSLDKEMNIVKTKIMLFTTVAVFAGNLAFQIVLRIFF